MRGMILAAGRGQRMGPLTDHTPKPLLRVADRYLIEYSIEALVKFGIKDIVINVSYLADQIIAALGDGERYGVKFHYSKEPEALETGGGVFQALPLLQEDAFVVLSCDVVTEYPLQRLPQKPEKLAHIVLVDNPSYHPQGDFCLVGSEVSLDKQERFTFANIGMYTPELFVNCAAGRFRLGDLLKQAIAQKQVTGEHFSGVWHNVGTPEDLETLAVFNSVE